MKIYTYTKQESPFEYEITYLEKGESRGWCEKKDGTWRYMSFGKGAVVVENSPAGYNWSEYNYPDDKVDSIAANLIKAGYTKTEV